MTTRGKAVILIGFPAVVFFGGILFLNLLGRSVMATDEKPIYMRFSGYNADSVRAYWGALDQTEVLPVESMLLKVDLLFPLLYGGALLWSILAASKAMGWTPLRKLAMTLVFIAAFADWMENSSLLLLLQSYVNDKTTFLDENLVQIASTATSLKFIFIGLSWIALFLLVGKFFRNDTHV